MDKPMNELEKAFMKGIDDSKSGEKDLSAQVSCKHYICLYRPEALSKTFCEYQSDIITLKDKLQYLCDKPRGRMF